MLPNALYTQDFSKNESWIRGKNWKYGNKEFDKRIEIRNFLNTKN